LVFRKHHGKSKFS